MFRVAKVIPQLLQGWTLTDDGIVTVGPAGDILALRGRGPEKLLNE
jgi:hypothetical protein